MKTSPLFFIILISLAMQGMAQTSLLENSRLWTTVAIYCQPTGNVYTSYSEKKIDLSHLSSGMYMLRIQSDAGNYSEKFLKQ